MRTWMWWVGWVSLGCASSPQGTTDNCVPGAQQACACVGGDRGAQRCRDDGSGYAECICPDGGTELGGAPATGGAAGNGGAPNATGGVPASGGTLSTTGGVPASGGTATTTGGVSESGGAMGVLGGGPSGSGGDCAGIIQKVADPAANLVFIVDKSGSMGNPPEGGDPAKKWNPLIAAFTGFFQNVPSPAMFASLTFFPAPCSLDTTPGSGGGCVCQASEYDPDQAQANSGQTVPLTQIVGHTSTFTDVLNQTLPTGGTPTVAALQGSFAYATTLQGGAKTPEDRTSVVLITDGSPGFGCTVDGGFQGCEGCTGNNVDTVARLVQGYHDQGIDTYVFGLGNLPALSTVAEAGGHALLSIDVGDPAATTQQILNSLNTIPKPTFTCTRPLPAPPPPADLDPTKLNVLFTNAATASPQLIAYNPSCISGDGRGWTLSGSDLRLCTATCDQLKLEPTTALSVEFGCATILAPP